jgi:hypothetical protein
LFTAQGAELHGQCRLQLSHADVHRQCSLAQRVTFGFTPAHALADDAGDKGGLHRMRNRIARRIIGMQQFEQTGFLMMGDGMTDIVTGHGHVCAKGQRIGVRHQHRAHALVHIVPQRHGILAAVALRDVGKVGVEILLIDKHAAQNQRLNLINV